MPFAANDALFPPIVPMKSKANENWSYDFHEIYILSSLFLLIMVWAMRVPNHIAVHKARIEIIWKYEDQKGYRNSAEDSGWLGNETRMCDLL